MKMEKFTDSSKQRFVISSYNKDIPSLCLMEMDIQKKTYQILDEKKLNAPSFVIQSGKYLFTYSKNPIQLVSYKVENNQMIKVDAIFLPGTTLTHLAYSKKHQKLFAASYLDGAYLSVDVKNGFFSNLSYFKQEENLDSKCHCVTLSKDENKVYITNIAQDKIYVYDFHLNYLETFHLPKGVGPRHMIIVDDYFYVITEYSNEVLVLDPKGILIERITTINGYPNKTNAATLLFHNGYLYASNRGLETIAVFKVNNHLLTYLKMIPTFGNHSRHMIFDKTKEYIISFNKLSNQISIINIKKEQEELSIPFEQVSSGVII